MTDPPRSIGFDRITDTPVGDWAGQLLVVPGTPISDQSDVQTIVRSMLEKVRPRGDDPDRLRMQAEQVGLRLAERTEITTPDVESTPREAIEQIERRTSSALWVTPRTRGIGVDARSVRRRISQPAARGRPWSSWNPSRR